MRAVAAILATVGGTMLLVLAIMIPLIIGQSIQLWNYVSRGELRADSIAFVENRAPEMMRGIMIA